jgi:hypothetical protein
LEVLEKSQEFDRLITGYCRGEISKEQLEAGRRELYLVLKEDDRIA